MTRIRKLIFALSIAIYFASHAAAPAFASAVSSNNPRQFTFLTIADIHFDPFISCYTVSKKPCPLIQKLRALPANLWADILQTYDTTSARYQQDTNYPLLKSALTDAKKSAQTKQVTFVLVLGDFLGHDFRHYYKIYSQDKSAAGYQLFVKKTLIFITSQIAQAFPGIDVYSVVGNNDTYFGDYASDPHGPFFADMGRLVSGLVKSKTSRNIMEQEFRSAGYYAVTIPDQPGLKLIVLNSVLFSYKAKGKGVSDAADKQLDWLVHELESVKLHHQKAIIAMHIPPGIDIFSTPHVRLFTLLELWQQKYTARFQAVLQTYAGQIAGLLAGHLHSDWAQFVITDNDQDITETGTPAISPIFGNNPGYKIYSYSIDPVRLNNFVTYYYPINNHTEWSAGYNFNRPNLLDCTDCPNKNNTLSLLGRLIHLSSDSAGAKWNPSYWCAIRDSLYSDVCT